MILCSQFVDGSHSEGGTFFVEEYMIPRGGSASFCLYDTRGFSQVLSSDNTSKIEEWITRGVCHGEPVIWFRFFFSLSVFNFSLWALISFMLT